MNVHLAASPSCLCVSMDRSTIAAIEAVTSRKMIWIFMITKRDEYNEPAYTQKSAITTYNVYACSERIQHQHNTDRVVIYAGNLMWLRNALWTAASVFFFFYLCRYFCLYYGALAARRCCILSAIVMKNAHFSSAQSIVTLNCRPHPSYHAHYNVALSEV